MQIVPSSLLTAPTLLACFTTRIGGVSQTPYSSANLAFHVGDIPDNVIENHNHLAAILGYERKHLIHMRQIHSDRIVIIDETMDFDTPPECDALITDRINIPLMVMSADCTPILLYDSINKVVACVHAGRAGALNGILPKTIQTMRKKFTTSPDHLVIAMGPSIHGCCYEINETIATQVHNANISNALRREGEKVYLDVNTILLHQLHTMGIESRQIEIINECTSCHHDKYFSYRADAQYTGRIAGVIMLRDSLH